MTSIFHMRAQYSSQAPNGTSAPYHRTNTTTP